MPYLVDVAHMGRAANESLLLLEKAGKTNSIDGDTPGLAAAVGSVATSTVFRQLIRQPGPRHDQGGRNDRSQEVVSDAVAVVSLFAGRGIVVGKFSVLPHLVVPSRECPEAAYLVPPRRHFSQSIRFCKVPAKARRGITPPTDSMKLDPNSWNLDVSGVL